MNTLSKQFTGTYFFNEEQENYNKLRKIWSELVKDEEKKHLLTSRLHILYMVLTGKDWRKAVTVATNPNKLANGYKPKYVLDFVYHSMSQWRYDHYVKPYFGDLFTLEQIQIAEKTMNIPASWHNFGKEDAYRDAE